MLKLSSPRRKNSVWASNDERDDGCGEDPEESEKEQTWLHRV
jgi:hypothetical protein